MAGLPPAMLGAKIVAVPRNEYGGRMVLNAGTGAPATAIKPTNEC